jgi:hypothetical protein
MSAHNAAVVSIALLASATACRPTVIMKVFIALYCIVFQFYNIYFINNRSCFLCFRTKSIEPVAGPDGKPPRNTHGVILAHRASLATDYGEDPGLKRYGSDRIIPPRTRLCLHSRFRGNDSVDVMSQANGGRARQLVTLRRHAMFQSP